MPMTTTMTATTPSKRSGGNSLFGGNAIAATRPSSVAAPRSASADTAAVAAEADLAVCTLARKIQAAHLEPVSDATRRRCMLASIYFTDYYYDMITYLDERKKRTRRVKDDIASRQLPSDDATAIWTAHCTKERDALRRRRTRVRLSSFTVLTQIGQGGYGQVFLARKRDTSEICALKKMSKRVLHRMGEVEHVLTERDILTWSNSVWLVRLLYAFQDTENVFLAMEYAPGGDLRTLLNNSGVLHEHHARFYVAEMGMAVAELHRLGYIHRDLKPENFLIDAGGHIKLTDFGLSRGRLSSEVLAVVKEKMAKIRDLPFVYRSIAERRHFYRSVRSVDIRAFSQVGSPDYMAYEVLAHSAAGGGNAGEGYDYSIDYWSLGCIMFECLAGFPPFTAATPDDVWYNVYHWRQVLERPVYTGEDEEFNFTDAAWDLVTRLIADRSVRLRSLTDLKAHPFFANFNFSALRTEDGPVPPFVPTLSSATDTAYFDDFSSEKDMAMYKEVRDRMADVAEKTKDPADPEHSDLGVRAAFIGFTYRHDAAANEKFFTGATMF